MAQFFGTDGVRGLTNQAPITAEYAMHIGMAAGAHFLRGDYKHRVVIGKDTRLSGYMLENALVAGFTSVGMDVVQVGPMPTPAVAMLTQSMRADLGVMISASHNHYHDNGIKLFGPDGYKLSQRDEHNIEALFQQPPSLAKPAQIGRAQRIDDARGRYIHAVKQSLSSTIRLDDLKIVVDCANGAAYNSAPIVFWELGADVVSIGVEPNGFNINQNCGSTAPKTLQAAVRDHGADIGVALDGDGDRLLLVDEKGQIVDGDQIMARLATSWAHKGWLKGGGIVATILSNFGLEHYLATQNLRLLRTMVGDRHVAELMRRKGCNVGGEQSGHVILSDYMTTGDGTLAALHILALLAESSKSASALLQCFDPVPQLMSNIPYGRGGTETVGGGDALSASGATMGADKSPLEDDKVKAAIAEGEAMLAGKGRLVIRPSGTEPMIRIMAEGDDRAQIAAVVETIRSAVQDSVYHV